MVSKKFIIPLLVGVLTTLASAQRAKAAYFSPLTNYSAADLEAQISNGTFIEEFNAASYIGDDGGPAYELEIIDIAPPDNVVNTQQGQLSWEQGATVDFELSFDGSNLTYTVDDVVVQALDVKQEDFDINGMILSANSTANSSATLSNLMLDDGSMSMDELLSSGADTDFLKISGLNNEFTLSGTQTFSWDGERPSDFDLAYQIRVGTFVDPIAAMSSAATEIPEPTAVSLFSLGAIALGMKRRRQ